MQNTSGLQMKSFLVAVFISRKRPHVKNFTNVAVSGVRFKLPQKIIGKKKGRRPFGLPLFCSELFYLSPEVVRS
jgi:hypothetical protein